MCSTKITLIIYPKAHFEGLSTHQMIHHEQLDKETMQGILQDVLSLCIDALGVKMSGVWKELASEEERSCKHPLAL
jgi:hypothetical protein